MPSHKNSRLNIWNDAAEVTKLYNNRWRVAIRCLPSNKVEDWYYANRGTTFAEFADNYDQQLDINGESEGWEPSEGEAWLDALLIRQEMGYTPSGEYVVTFIYETLTDSYVEDRKEEVDYELNGLRRVTRTLIAKEGTSYAKVVGTDTISHTAIGYGSVTLTLGSVDDAQLGDDEGGYTRIREVWLEQGLLVETTTPESTGLSRVSRTYLVSAPAATNPVVSETTQNVEGLQTITQVTLERSDGGSIISSEPTNSFGRMFNFTYPGIVGVSTVTTTSTLGDNAINRFFYQQSPVERPIPATSYVFFQTSSQPTASDYVYDGASGLWSPSEWAGGIYYGWRYQRDNFGTPIGERPGFRGFRAVEDDSEIPNVVTSLSGEATDDDGLSGTLLLNGTTYEISVSGGPEKPDGNKYTLGLIDIQPAFIDVNGVQYYKKIITVATIPEQGGSVIT